MITRGGRRVAELSPTPAANGAAVRDALRRHAPDSDWADDLNSVRSLLYVEDHG